MLNYINNILYKWLMRGLFWDKFYYAQKLKYHIECYEELAKLGLANADALEKVGALQHFPIQEFNKKMARHMYKRDVYKRLLGITLEQIKNMEKQK
jgi:hypothetical protein